VTQAVVALKSSPAAGVKDVAGLKGLKLGAQVGTTSYTAAKAVDQDVGDAPAPEDGGALLGGRVPRQEPAHVQHALPAACGYQEDVGVLRGDDLAAGRPAMPLDVAWSERG
jgi:hypothetical protein